MMDALAIHREDILERAEAMGWPPIIVPGVCCILTEAAWIAAVELATGTELIRLSGVLLETAE